VSHTGSEARDAARLNSAGGLAVATTLPLPLPETARG